MSHQTYLETCDEGQTRALFDLCAKKLAAIKQEGWQNLWVVSDDCVNLKWFLEGDYPQAVDYLQRVCLTSFYNGDCTEIHLKLERVRPSEVKEYLE